MENAENGVVLHSSGVGDWSRETQGRYVKEGKTKGHKKIIFLKMRWFWRCVFVGCQSIHHVQKLYVFSRWSLCWILVITSLRLKFEVVEPWDYHTSCTWMYIMYLLVGKYHPRRCLLTHGFLCFDIFSLASPPPGSGSCYRRGWLQRLPRLLDASPAEAPGFLLVGILSVLFGCHNLNVFLSCWHFLKIEK